MPGTIDVSVLEFKGITSSAPPASVFIKVSMGKTEYQTWDKGDFSFPLTTLQDSLTVRIHDPDGNEMSSLGVQSMSIVEKGMWNHLFPLEGGGYLHMKLQFSLSENERNRIRSMRESALKKKQEEVLNKEKRYSKLASGSGVSIASSSPSNHEVSGAGKHAGSWPNPDTSFKDLDSNNWKEQVVHRQKTPNATDSTQESSSAKLSLGIESHNISLPGKIDTHLPRAIISEAPKIFQNYLSTARGSEPVVAKIKPVVPKLEDNPVGKHEKQVPLRKPASSIMKMISAFETTLVQEKKPPVVQVAAKSQENRARKEGPLKEQVLGHVTKVPELISGRPKFQIELSSGRVENPAEDSSERLSNPAQLGSEKLGNPFLTRLQQLPPDSMNKGKHIDFDEDFGKVKQCPAITAHETVESRLKSDRIEKGKERDRSPEALKDSSTEPREHKLLPESMETGEQFEKDSGSNKPSQGTSQLIGSSALKLKSNEANASIMYEPKSDIKESTVDQDDSFEDLMRSSPLKPSTILEKVEEKTSLGLQPCNVFVEQKGSNLPSVVERLEAIKTKYSSGVGAFNDKLNFVASCKDEQHRYETSRAWIFPDDTTHMCVTSGVSPVMELYDGCHSEGKKNDGLVLDNLEKHEVLCESDEMNENESTLLNLRESKPQNSADNALIGSVKQAIKIAIVIGFGALVLFTRQREPRKNSRKGNDIFFDNLP